MPDFYGTETGLDTYADQRGLTIPAGDVEQALFRASAWIDANYGGRFTGWKTNRRAQVRLWPRAGAYDAEYINIASDEIPIEIEQATYEAALVELANPLSLTPIITKGSIKQSVSVGNVAVTYAASGGIADQRPTLTIIDGILAPLLGMGSSKVTGTASRG